MAGAAPYSLAAHRPSRGVGRQQRQRKLGRNDPIDRGRSAVHVCAVVTGAVSAGGPPDTSDSRNGGAAFLPHRGFRPDRGLPLSHPPLSTPSRPRRRPGCGPRCGALRHRRARRLAALPASARAGGRTARVVGARQAVRALAGSAVARSGRRHRPGRHRGCGPVPARRSRPAGLRRRVAAHLPARHRGLLPTPRGRPDDRLPLAVLPSPRLSVADRLALPDPGQRRVRGHAS